MLLCIMFQNDVKFSSASEIHIVYGSDALQRQYLYAFYSMGLYVQV